jgi:hypothetical protein
MILLRLVLIGFVLWLAFRIVRRFLLAKKRTDRDATYRGKMVTCEVCGVYLPETDATAKPDGLFYCDKH